MGTKHNMMGHSVLPASAGGWVGFLSGPRVLAVPSGSELVASEEFVGSAWQAINGDDAFPVLLDLLTARGLPRPPHSYSSSGSQARMPASSCAGR